MALIHIDESRERLFAGLRRFQREVYPKQEAAYRRAVLEGQKPHALFITCADSRIDPELITQSGPGEIFVSRNIGNVVPAYGEISGSVSAIVEYAVAGLKVSHVVVCGHSDCGAMIGLLHPEKVAQLPVVKSWLRGGETALSIVRSRNPEGDEHAALEELVEENVLQQLHHLRTHPSVAGRLAQGSLALSGWVYDIGNGTVRVYDEGQRKFLPLPADENTVSGAGQ
ncbi:MAG TPA: carbonic anhydrase [Candidatus Acidoferrales bacterium]|nr:carbonic anhydrase [Candidatus Acidoferrales bacterium]